MEKSHPTSTKVKSPLGEMNSFSYKQFIFIVHSVHWSINHPQKHPSPPLSCQAPPLNLQTAQLPPLLSNLLPSIYGLFVTPPFILKIGFLSEPQRY